MTRKEIAGGPLYEVSGANVTDRDSILLLLFSFLFAYAVPLKCGLIAYPSHHTGYIRPIIMQRCSRRLLTAVPLLFDTLLCGHSRDLLAQHSQEAVREMKKRAPAAALPVPLAAVVLSQQLRSVEAGSSVPRQGPVAALSTHPEREAVALQLVTDWTTATPDSSHTRVLHSLRLLTALQRADVREDAVTKAAQRLTAWCVAGCDEGCEEQLESLRVWLLHAMRYSPSSAPSLLTSLCLTTTKSSPSEAEQDLLSGLQQALKAGFVDPRSVRLALQRTSSSSSRVLRLWRCLQHTTSSTDREVASMVIIALARQQRFAESVRVLQGLAAARASPTVAAQGAVLSLLCRTSPPQPNYGDQLFEFWYSGHTAGSSQVWSAPPAAMRVYVALVYLHFRCGAYTRCIDLLMNAAEHLTPKREEQSTTSADNTGVERLKEFLCSRGLLSVLRYAAEDVLKSPPLRHLFLNRPLELLRERETEGFSNSRVYNIVLLLARRAGPEAVQEVLSALEAQKAKVSQEEFERVCRYVAQDRCEGAHEDCGPHRILELLAGIWGKSIPDEVVEWLSHADL